MTQVLVAPKTMAEVMVAVKIVAGAMKLEVISRAIIESSAPSIDWLLTSRITRLISIYGSRLLLIKPVGRSECFPIC